MRAVAKKIVSLRMIVFACKMPGVGEKSLKILHRKYCLEQFVSFFKSYRLGQQPHISPGSRSIN